MPGSYFDDTAYCFDLDGTVTLLEILPEIARHAGIYDEISILTEATLKGLLSFEKSFRLRCRLISDVGISTVQDIVAAVPLDPHILQFIRGNSKNCFIVTGNLDLWIEPLIAKIGCQVFSSVGERAGDRLTGLASVLHKRDAVNEVRKQFGRVIAIGESMNDVPMFEAADIGVAYGGVHEPIASLVDIADFVAMNGTGLCRLLKTL